MKPIKTLAKAEAHAAKAYRLMLEAMDTLSESGLAIQDYDDYDVARHLDASTKGLRRLRKTMKQRARALGAPVSLACSPGGNVPPTEKSRAWE